LQWWSWLKISFCEIFGVVQFSTFATKSAQSGRSVSAVLLSPAARDDIAIQGGVAARPIAP
jgi:hypothetical protein